MNENINTQSSAESVAVARNPLVKRTNTNAAANNSEIVNDLQMAADQAMQERDLTDASQSINKGATAVIDEILMKLKLGKSRKRKMEEPTQVLNN